MVAPGVSLTVPDYIVPTGEQGVDSTARALSGRGITIIVDEGPFSDPLTRYADQPGFDVSTESINGHPARIVYFEDEQGVRHLMARLDILDKTEISRPVTIVIHMPPDMDFSIARQVLESVHVQP